MDGLGPSGIAVSVEIATDVAMLVGAVISGRFRMVSNCILFAPFCLRGRCLVDDNSVLRMSNQYTNTTRTSRKKEDPDATGEEERLPEPLFATCAFTASEPA
jgi:hypothetical protein